MILPYERKKSVFNWSTKDSQGPIDPSKLLNNIIAQEREHMALTTDGTLILNLIDSVLRQVIEEETTCKILIKLEGLYATKDLPNNMYLREKFFTYKMDPSKFLTDKPR